MPMQRKVYEKGMAYSAGICQKKAYQKKNLNGTYT